MQPEILTAMTAPEWLSTLTCVWMLLALPVAVVLFFINAPYGRHNPGTWGPAVNARLGWILMESPAVVVPTVFFVMVRGWESPVMGVFFLIWQGHYVYRAWIYPFCLAKASSPMPALLMVCGMLFNMVNGSLLGAWLFIHPTVADSRWLASWPFVAGCVLFGIGMAVNFDSSRRLLRLRRENPDGYSIPRGGMFRWVSCPNYLGEIVEWLGWALLTWSPAGLAFAVWTMTNLVPRARAHHRWYLARFPDYPTGRRILVPGIF